MTIETDEAAVLKVVNAETDAWLRRDLDALASHWVHSPQSRRMSSLANLGTQVQEGWDEIFMAFKRMAEQFPNNFKEDRVRRENMNIVICGDAAYVSFDQIGENSDDKFEMVGVQHELRFFLRVDGAWKIACIVVLQRNLDHKICPLIEVGADKTVRWINAAAHEEIAQHPYLIISGGKLRARNRTSESNLQDTVSWASRNLHWNDTTEAQGRGAKPVVLGENDDGAPIFCWVLVQDGKILVSFNDTQLVKNRVELARGIYGLSAAQLELAQLLAEGQDLSSAAEKLGVSINTLRTHLQRMFDKTGARSQSALVSILLSADAPTAT